MRGAPLIALSVLALLGGLALVHAAGQTDESGELKEGEPLFVGDADRMYFCFKHDRKPLPYVSCKKRFEPGSRLLRPYIGPEGVGAEEVNVKAREVVGKWGACPDVSTYTGGDAKQKIVGAVGTAADRQAWLLPVAKRLKAKLGVNFVTLSITRVTRADLDADGQSETIVEAATRTGKTLGHVEDHALSYVAVARGEAAHPKWADVYLHFAPRKKAAEDLYTASVFGKLAGLADLNGDGRPELIVETGYYEGGGLEIHAYRDGDAKKLGDNGCGV